MNNKGFFFSLSAILIVLVIGAFIFYSGSNENKKDFAQVQYTKHSQVINYIELLRNDYIPSFITTSSKLSLYNMSYEVNVNPASQYSSLEDNLTNAINTGHTDGNINDPDTFVNYYTFPHFINITSEVIPVDFTFENTAFTVRSVEQINPKTIRLNSTMEISISSIENGTIDSHIIWSDTINYSLNISVIGFIDPVEGEVITGFWDENSTKDCFLKTISYNDCIYESDIINGISHPLP